MVGLMAFIAFGIATVLAWAAATGHTVVTHNPGDWALVFLGLGLALLTLTLTALWPGPPAPWRRRP